MNDDYADMVDPDSPELPEPPAVLQGHPRVIRALQLSDGGWIKEANTLPDGYVWLQGKTVSVRHGRKKPVGWRRAGGPTERAIQEAAMQVVSPPTVMTPVLFAFIDTVERRIRVIRKAELNEWLVEEARWRAGYYRDLYIDERIERERRRLNLEVDDDDWIWWLESEHFHPWEEDDEQ